MSAGVIVLLLLGQSLAVAPGDEDVECGVPHYPTNIRVLLDSWRYQTLLGWSDPTNDEAVWTTYSATNDQTALVSKYHCTFARPFQCTL